MYSRLLLILAFVVASDTLPAQAPKGEKGVSAGDAKPKKAKNRPLEAEEIETSKRRAERLFGPDEPVEFTLAVDFKSAFKSRDTLNVKVTKGTFTVKDSSGNPVSVPVEISPRGHFRLRSDVCNFPPIRLKFPKQGLKGTPFAGQEALKLGTHCQRNDKEFAEYPVREHATYEMLNMLTDASFKSRLARVTYVQPGSDADTIVKLGVLIEDEADMAKRNGGRIQTVRGGTFNDMDTSQMAVMTLFAFFVGNTDWSLSSLHNVRLVMTNDGRYLPVPYDFDWSGAVYARYAKPDPRLGLRTVQDRLFRGPCFPPEHLSAVLGKFSEKKPAIRELYARLPLEDGYRKRALDYLEEFYRIIGDQRQTRREFVDSCVGRLSS